MTSIANASSTGLVPLFPLPEVCLLPGELLPLYVFEPRYRALLKDAMAGDRLIAMPRFAAGWEDTYYGNPEVEPTFGVGTIVAHRPRPDGSAEIVLRGIARVRLLEIVREMPYRIGRVDDLPEQCSEPAALAATFAEISALCSTVLTDPGFARDDQAAPIAAELAGRVMAVAPIALKQRVLNADDQVERYSYVLQWLRSCDFHRRQARMLDRLNPQNLSPN